MLCAALSYLVFGMGKGRYKLISNKQHFFRESVEFLHLRKQKIIIKQSNDFTFYIWTKSI